MRFEDYHRTVIGYHGTQKSVAMAAVQLQTPLNWSRNDWDWLGSGLYFWEYAPQQAWQWAEALRRSNRWKDETAVVACMIRLGNCLDLLDPENVKAMRSVYGDYLADLESTNTRPPVNVRSRKRLNCAAFNYAYSAFEARGQSVDTCRAVFVPSEDNRLWSGSGINSKAHIQLVVRNPLCILGTWLVKPTEGG